MGGNQTIRICGNKVRSGCLTCKTRHIKCGEEKPQCRRCITSGRICDGYRGSQAVVQPSVKRSAKDPMIIHYTSHLPATLNVEIGRNAKEQRSFHYFRTRTAPDLRACFDSELWSSYVLQLAHSEPAIQHSVIALGCLHEYFENAATSYNIDSEFALRQYTKAIQHGIQSFEPRSSRSTDVALLLCTLFASFESLQGHYSSAVTHITSGVKLILERQANGRCRTQSQTLMRLLNSVFNQLGSQVLQIAKLSTASTVFQAQDCAAGIWVPKGFSTIEEGLDSFNSFLNKLLCTLQQLDTVSDGLALAPAQMEPFRANVANLTHSFEQWSGAFDEYLGHHANTRPPSIYPLGKQIQPEVSILQMWRIVVQMRLSCGLPAGETSWDCFIDEYESIIDLATVFLDHTAKFITNELPSLAPLSPITTLRPDETVQVGTLGAPQWERRQRSSVAPSPQSITYIGTAQGTDPFTTRSSTPFTLKPPVTIKPTFSLSLGIVPPLYIVSIRCRHPVIRRKAIDLLSICNRREGVWDSWLSSSVARRLLQIEEEGAREYLRCQVDRDEDVILKPIEITDAAQIPEHVRVVHVGTSFGPERQGSIHYMKSQKGREGLSGPPKMVEERFVW